MENNETENSAKRAFSLSKILRTAERIQAWVLQALILGLLALLVWAGVSWTKDRMAQEIYAERLSLLNSSHQALRVDYERIMSETALTQIFVGSNNAVSVRMSLADGRIEDIPVGVDPSKEVYVDYVLLDNRLWIRRIFDADTPPSAAEVLEWDLHTINWNERPSNEFGKAVYRSLEPGLWEITMTGNGALSLGPAQDRVPSVSPFPEIMTPDLALETADEIDENITLGDIWAYWMNRWVTEKE